MTIKKFKRSVRNKTAAVLLLAFVLSGCGNQEEVQPEDFNLTEAVVSESIESVSKMSDSSSIAESGDESSADTISDSDTDLDKEDPAVGSYEQEGSGQTAVFDPEVIAKGPEAEMIPYLNCVTDEKQVILVLGEGTSCTVGLYKRNTDNSWREILRSDGYVGSNGIGDAREGSCMTPQGFYHILTAFGNGEDPGSLIPFRQIEASDYYVGDPNSPHYNKYVSIEEVNDFDPSIGEHLIDCGDAYKYVLDFDYNPDGTPYAGSCFFLHCNIGRPTEGCITVPEEMMVRFLQSTEAGCGILIIDREAITTLFRS